ncbi:hypothetical protein EDB89DRAFT_2243298, partial [Lactarius sanguifluus]
MGTQGHWHSQGHSPVSLSSVSELILSVGSPSPQLAIIHSPYRVIRPPVPLHIPEILLKVIARNNRTEALEREPSLCGTGGRHPTTIGMLPDNVLLDMFDFYRKNHNYTLNPVWKWNILVHVCQTWRQIVFASPYRLDLKILCTYGTPVRENLGIWPAFPIIIQYNHSWFSAITSKDKDNIVYALKHRDRVCDVEFSPRVRGSRLEKLVAAMQKPFPLLTRLYICSAFFRDPPVIPAEFLGGSAPRLRELTLSGISYITLPVLLLSATDLVKLDLRNIPPTGYTSPEAMVACLATLLRLDCFAIEFLSATPFPYRNRIHPPPITRTVLPALTSFEFKGASGYLEDLVGRIDNPQLKWVAIDLQLVDYQVTQLSKFIDRSVGPKLTLSKRAHVQFFDHCVTFVVYPHTYTRVAQPHKKEGRAEASSRVTDPSRVHCQAPGPGHWHTPTSTTDTRQTRFKLLPPLDYISQQLNTRACWAGIS